MNLPYALTLEHVATDGTVTTTIQEPHGLKVDIPPHLKDAAFVIPVDLPDQGLRGEIVMFREKAAEAAGRAAFEEKPVELMGESSNDHVGELPENAFLRGGFRVGGVPGLSGLYSGDAYLALVETFASAETSSNFKETNLARSSVTSDEGVAQAIFSTCIAAIFDRFDELEGDTVSYALIEEIVRYQHPDTLREVLRPYDAAALYKGVPGMVAASPGNDRTMGKTGIARTAIPRIL